MFSAELTLEARDEILARYDAARSACETALREGQADRLVLHEEEGLLARDEYFRRLPRVTMACGPVDGKPLIENWTWHGPTRS